MTDYNDGNWHFWNGGECPVHPESMIDMVWPSFMGVQGSFREERKAKNFSWNVGGASQPMMFRVTKPYRGPETYTGECFAYHYTNLAPTLAEFYVNTSIHGKYTATHINGKLAKIVWEASE